MIIDLKRLDVMPLEILREIHELILAEGCFRLEKSKISEQLREHTKYSDKALRDKVKNLQNLQAALDRWERAQSYEENGGV